MASPFLASPRSTWLRASSLLVVVFGRHTAAFAARSVARPSRFATRIISWGGRPGEDRVYEGDDFGVRELSRKHKEQNDEGQWAAKCFVQELQLRSDLASLMAASDDNEVNQGIDSKDPVFGETSTARGAIGALFPANRRLRMIVYTVAMAGASLMMLRYYWAQALVSVGLLSFYFALVTVLSRVTAFQSESNTIDETSTLTGAKEMQGQ
jgi:hypothetical protein